MVPPPECNLPRPAPDIGTIGRMQSVASAVPLLPSQAEATPDRPGPVPGRCAGDLIA
jgi:hypothetical protein